ncbi:uncharacterized protein AB675_5556 [Cyphellophora attinorum]|uniref:LCCL domain-containing protein n=1 Tax=Cyphellophora attinorum TaxID=1664694 RepID=A0A0N1P0J6_9EURO|nr:uncharacterized protein AB675_5556 [Phialophora attinorum]KPI42154.1 hypothetical protein AB675_5556 [Phialophora attinorum]
MTTPHPYRDDEEAGPHIPPLTDDESETETTADLHIRSSSQSSTENEPNGRRLPVPAWLRKPGGSSKYDWVAEKARHVARAVVTWTKGPVPSQEPKIIPLFPKIQQAPIQLLDQYLPNKRHRICLLGAFYAVWFLIWSLMLRDQLTSGSIQGYGRPSNVGCATSFWAGSNRCGVNGNECRPFTGLRPFRCPAKCDRANLLEERWVGNGSHIYEPLVIGGPDPEEPEAGAIYRGDSWLCLAAVHAGVIELVQGGCGVAELIGEHDSFTGSKQHGIKSFDFPASFRMAYRFLSVPDKDMKCPSTSKWPMFAVTAVALSLLSIFTTSPAVFFFSLYYITIFHVGLVSDPPSGRDFYGLVSTLFGTMLPGSFMAYVIYITSARPLLRGLTAQFEKTILYLSFFSIGALNNYTFEGWIPIARLTPRDLRQPGAVLALVIIIGIIATAAVVQILSIRRAGRLPKYLAIYATFGVGLLLLFALPGERLRLHHYFYPLMLLPGTGFQTRPGLVFQGILLGLHINGAARWGFDSIIQTPADLHEGNDGNGRSWWGAHAPVVNATVSSSGNKVELSWGAIPTDTGVDGISIMVNDVEYWRRYVEEMDYTNGTTLEKRGSREIHEPWFVRLAWMNGREHGRHSNPATWDVDGSWIPSNQTRPDI